MVSLEEGCKQRKEEEHLVCLEVLNEVECRKRNWEEGELEDGPRRQKEDFVVRRERGRVCVQKRRGRINSN